MQQQNPVPQGRIRRTMPLAGFTARAAGGRMVAALRERAGDAGAVGRFHDKTAEGYAELLGHSKGVLMKAGQILSMVDTSSVGSGGFSPYQKALARLQADAPPMDPALARDVLSADLGRPVHDVLWRFHGGSQRHANLFHADPHPANCRFGTDGRVGVVDFGCVKVIPERQRRRLIGLSRAVIEGRKDDVLNLMAELGYFADGITLSVDEAYQWMAEIHYEVLAAQPVTYDQTTSQRAVGALVDVRRCSDHPVRRVTVPGELLFFSRINLTANAILASLGATVHARAIVDDLDGVAEPTTSLGKQHDAWVRQRGLPYGLQPHDHP